MNGIETLVFAGLEFAGSIGMTTVMTGAAMKAVPKGINTAEKVCVGVGVGMATIAADQIVCREVEGWYKDLKKEVRRITKKQKKHYSSHKQHNDKKWSEKYRDGELTMEKVEE